MDREEVGRIMGQIVARAWTDDTFRQRLLADATAVLRDEGIEVPEGLEIRVLENTGKLFHLVLPSKPASFRQLNDEELEAVAGGAQAGASACGYCGGFDEILHPSTWKWGAPGGGIF